jgi:hypothetical protein
MEDKILICGVLRIAAVTGRPCRWDKTRWNGSQWVGEPAPLVLTYALDGVDEKYAPSIAYAWREWEKVCAITVSRVQDARLADIRYTAKRIDGGSGTLAWAELPCGPDRQLESRFDSADSWHFDPSTPPPRGKIHCGAVACHEAGHLLGLEHETNNATTSLLDPYYRPDVLVPQQWDIAQVQMRYGPPIAPPTPPTTPTNPDGLVPCRIVIDGATYEGLVEEV